MNTYYVKTDEQYSATVEVEADYYSVGHNTLDFWVRKEDPLNQELVASFWNGDWRYVEKAEEVEYE